MSVLIEAYLYLADMLTKIERYDDANGAFTNAQKVGENAKQLVNSFVKKDQKPQRRNSVSSNNQKPQRQNPTSYNDQGSTRNFKIRNMARIDSEDEPGKSYDMGEIEMGRIKTEPDAKEMGRIKTESDAKQTFDAKSQFGNTTELSVPEKSFKKQVDQAGSIEDRQSSFKSDFSETNEGYDGISATMPDEILELRNVIFKKYLRLDNTRYKFVVADMKNQNSAVVFLYNKPRRMMQKLFVNYEDLANFYTETGPDSDILEADYDHGNN